MEPYHWKGLLLQSFAFDMLSNGNSDYYGRPERSASTAEQAVLVANTGLAAALQYAALERRRHSLLKEPVRRDDGRANYSAYGSKEPEGCTNNGDRA